MNMAPLQHPLQPSSCSSKNARSISSSHRNNSNSNSSTSNNKNKSSTRGAALATAAALLLASLPTSTVATGEDVTVDSPPTIANSTAALRGALPTAASNSPEGGEEKAQNQVQSEVQTKVQSGARTKVQSEVQSQVQTQVQSEVRTQSRSEASWANAGACGIATNLLDLTDQGMSTFCDMGLDFWWNWNGVPKRSYSSPCYSSTHVPMIWGIGGLNAQLAATHASRLMGYNEPDLYGPPAYPGGDYLSSGSFTPTFHCGGEAIARDWQNIVTIYKRTNPNGVVVSPAMADPSGTASSGAYEACNSALQRPDSFMAYCPGWLKCFKENVKKLQCGDTNCWDVIDVIQFHAYVYTAEDLIEAVIRWEDTWFEDLFGLNGNKKKSLWLTEFARAGAVDSTDPDGKTREFMTTAVQYLKASPHISGWSWFSQDVSTFASFVIGGVVPASPRWSSELINQQGQATVIGEHYAQLCRGEA